MTEPTRVQFETLPPVSLYLPGPNASKAGCILDRIRDLATHANLAKRFADDADIDAPALQLVEEALQRATRAIRHAQRGHTAAYAAELQARDMGLDTSTQPETPTNEPSPERHP